ncbi:MULTISPECIES: oxygenase MpaB family protein [unclassified Rhodococcus (in: high G+C Gram-positive bacteria)]|uniref:oxygenase MpaB family protein n=1 Tax=unclassified Rhodococcus (in: high G+C Gram-positive bacteria) TaxID=192944 RepID=UPI0014461359|nr:MULTISPECIES: oxygenase MpaB family protein [unclassified Rhodococcus (in: high G+C Gram-positive bacteria)]
MNSPLDFGIFGPESVTWKVYRYPTSMTVGFTRTALTEMFDPLVVASVAGTDSLRQRAADRYDRTLEYAGALVLADSATAAQAADTLMRIHSKISGLDPETGQTYDPNDPVGQLWIHLTQWQSVLHVYERFGPGRLSEEDERQYWKECAIAAQFQTIDPADVPRSRAEMRAYYQRVRPGMLISETAIEHAQIILDGANPALTELPGPLSIMSPLAQWLLRRATIATLPRWMRTAIGSRQGPIVDAVVTAVLRPAMRLAARQPKGLAKKLESASPRAYAVLAPAILDIPPTTPETVTVQEAFRRAGRPLPREQYLALVGDSVNSAL